MTLFQRLQAFKALNIYDSYNLVFEKPLPISKFDPRFKHGEHKQGILMNANNGWLQAILHSVKAYDARSK